MLGWCYLATICNSTIIEFYGDKIRKSQRFRGFQILQLIAVKNSYGLKKIAVQSGLKL